MNYFFFYEDKKFFDSTAADIDITKDFGEIIEYILTKKTNVAMLNDLLTKIRSAPVLGNYFDAKYL